MQSSSNHGSGKHSTNARLGSNSASPRKPRNKLQSLSSPQGSVHSLASKFDALSNSSHHKNQLLLSSSSHHKQLKSHNDSASSLRAELGQLMLRPESNHDSATSFVSAEQSKPELSFMTPHSSMSEISPTKRWAPKKVDDHLLPPAFRLMMSPQQKEHGSRSSLNHSISEFSASEVTKSRKAGDRTVVAPAAKLKRKWPPTRGDSGDGRRRSQQRADEVRFHRSVRSRRSCFECRNDVPDVSGHGGDIDAATSCRDCRVVLRKWQNAEPLVCTEIADQDEYQGLNDDEEEILIKFPVSGQKLPSGPRPARKHASLRIQYNGPTLLPIEELYRTTGQVGFQPELLTSRFLSEHQSKDMLPSRPRRYEDSDGEDDDYKYPIDDDDVTVISRPDVWITPQTPTNSTNMWRVKRVWDDDDLDSLEEEHSVSQEKVLTQVKNLLGVPLDEPEVEVQPDWKVTRVYDVDGAIQEDSHRSDEDDSIRSMIEEDLLLGMQKVSDEYLDLSDYGYDEEDEVILRRSTNKHGERAYSRPDDWVSPDGDKKSNVKRSWKIKGAVDFNDSVTSISTPNLQPPQNDTADNETSPKNKHGQRAFNRPDDWVSPEGVTKTGVKRSWKIKGAVDLNDSVASISTPNPQLPQTDAGDGATSPMSKHGERAYSRPDDWVSPDGVKKTDVKRSWKAKGTLDLNDSVTSISTPNPQPTQADIADKDRSPMSKHGERGYSRPDGWVSPDGVKKAGVKRSWKIKGVVDLNDSVTSITMLDPSEAEPATSPKNKHGQRAFNRPDDWVSPVGGKKPNVKRSWKVKGVVDLNDSVSSIATPNHPETETTTSPMNKHGQRAFNRPDDWVSPAGGEKPNAKRSWKIKGTIDLNDSASMDISADTSGADVKLDDNELNTNETANMEVDRGDGDAEKQDTEENKNANSNQTEPTPSAELISPSGNKTKKKKKKKNDDGPSSIGDLLSPPPVMQMFWEDG